MYRQRGYGFLLALLFSFVWAASASAAGLKDFAGKEKTISDYVGNGKWGIVMIWASDCHTCNQEAHAYIKFHEQHKGTDAQVLGISMDGKNKLAEAKKFVKRHGVTFPSLIGEPEDVAMKFMKLTGSEWIGTPTFLIYTPKGELVAKEEGAVPVSMIEEFIKPKTSAK